MPLKIKESELKALLEEVSADLSKAFESEKKNLRKDEKPEGSPEESGAPAVSDEDSSAPPESAAPEAPAPESAPPQSAPPEASMSPEGSMPPEGSQDPAAEASLTPEALQAEYAKLPPEELDMHLKAALSAKAAMAGGQPGMDQQSAPPMAPPAGPSAPPAGPSAPPMAMKSEPDMAKSEDFSGKINELQALVKSQAEDVQNLAKALTTMLGQPTRKAVTGIAQIDKTEAVKVPLTKADVHARLKELSKKPELKKSERQLINDFYDKRVSIDKLAALFEDYKQ